MSATTATKPDLVSLASELGLSADEYTRLLQVLGREPNETELAVFSVMWSEHCSYKSSRAHLKNLPSQAPQVIYGPGENAGAVDIGDGDAAIFKIESHNHPSFLEPYQGAATGVGGILRDVFCMGARPIALLNALRFGAPDHPKTQHLLSEVVSGIADYGNCIGVPTVGGELGFDAGYNENILVNAMCVGLARTDKIFTARARGVGNALVYVGAKTGRDGIHGATMASAEFSADAEAQSRKRPNVQIGDPFYEKLLLEACLELLQGNAVEALQDMGAAGLTSSSVEMASKGGLGLELQLDAVPVRERDMQAHEILLSESQERMLMVIHPAKLEEAQKIFSKWGLDYAAIGTLTDTQRFVAHANGERMADIPLAALGDEAPLYERPQTPTPAPAPANITPVQLEPLAVLEQLLAHLTLCARRWVWEQYDHMVMADTLAPPGGDAALVRVHGTNKALALCCDTTPRYCARDPQSGGQQAIAESWRNLTAVGATPLAWTNCLNFGNPERPEVMGQFAACVQGMSEAARALAYPVVSGNVSFYNETEGRAIAPTPTIGGVGLLQDSTRAASVGLAAGARLYLVGATRGHLECSRYAQSICNLPPEKIGAPPPVDLEEEKRIGDFVREQIQTHGLRHAHDISDGGVLVALAEMVLASGIGADCSQFTPPTEPHAFWFGEDQARYLLAVDAQDEARFLAQAQAHNISHLCLGTGGGTALTLAQGQTISVTRLSELHEQALPRYMEDQR